MKKTKKALLSAIACSAVLVGAAFGFAGCKDNNNDGGDEAHSHNWGNWTVTTKPTKGQDGKATRTCSGGGACDATQAEKEYTLPNLDSEDYVRGKDTATCTTAGTMHYTYNKNGVSVEFDVATAINSTAHKFVGDYIETTGGHYQVCEYDHEHKSSVEAHDTDGTDGTCSKCGYDPNHEHTYDETTWQKDETGHWHAATCGHEVKGDFAEHTYNWEVTTPATATTEGVETGTCMVEGCGYVTTRAIPKLPTAVTGGEMEDDATALTAGRYSVVLTGTNYGNESNPWWFVDAPYFKITATEAKTYTLSIENATGYINYGGSEPVIDSYSVVLEAGESFVFNVSADDIIDTVNGDKVIFSITESAAPAEGSAARPIKVTDIGHFGKADVEDEEKVFFVIDWKALGGKTLGVTLGANVELHRVKEDYLASGDNKDLYVENDQPVVYRNGDKFKMPDYSNVYLYATCRGGDCFVDFTFEHLEGEKELPFTGKTGTETNAVAGQDDQWFKFEGLTAGQYIIKSTSADDSFEVYADVNGSAVASGNGIVVFTASADTTYYVKANGSLGSDSTFTVSEAAEADRGTTAGLAIDLTEKGDFDLLNGDGYYKFTAAQDGKAEFKFAGEGSIYITYYTDANFSTARDSGRNGLIFSITNGTTYYVKTGNESNVTGQFNFNYGATSEHTYVVTLSDGENTITGSATVKLAYFIEGEGTQYIDGTANSDGTYTFTNVDSAIAYRVVVTDLAGYSYYAADLEIPINIDETTAYTAVLIPTEKVYTITFTGADAGADLSGITVSLSGGGIIGSFTATTNAEGVATVNGIDPYANGNFIVTVSIPEGLSNTYVYVPEKDRLEKDKDLFVTASQPTVEVPLSKKMTYNLTLTDGTNPLPEGTKVTINGVSGTVGAEGKVSIATVAGVYEIKIEGYKTETKTSATEADISATCTISNEVEGSASRGDAPAVKMGETPFVGSVDKNRYCKFTAAEAGTYTFSFVVEPGLASSDFGIANLTLNGGDTEDFYNESYNDTKYQVEWSGWYAGTLTVTLEANDVLVLAIYNSGNITITKA